MTGLILLIIGVGAVVLLITKTRRNDGGYNVPGAIPFTPTHADQNIAIDTNSGRIWLRDEKGRVWIFHKSAVRTWKHHWTEWRNQAFTFREKNYIEICVDDLDRPTHRVPFDKFSDKFGNQRNHTTANEWSDRLTTFIND